MVFKISFHFGTGFYLFNEKNVKSTEAFMRRTRLIGMTFKMDFYKSEKSHRHTSQRGCGMCHCYRRGIRKVGYRIEFNIYLYAAIQHC